MKNLRPIPAVVLILSLTVAGCNVPFQVQDGPSMEEPLEEGGRAPEEPGGEGGQSESPGEAEIAYFAANRSRLQPGECAVIEWSVRGSLLITMNGERVDAEGSREYCPRESTSYRLAADAGTHMLEREITLVVEGSGEPQPQQLPSPEANAGPTQPGSNCPGAPVITSFSANPSTINAGGASTLQWGAVTNGAGGPLVGSVVLSPGFGEVGSPGSRVVKPATTTTYTLKGTGCGGATSKQVTIVVNAGPAAPSGVDLAITDLYSQNLPKGDVYARITNHGPGALSNVMVDLSCTVDRTDYATGFKSSVAKSYPATATLDLKAGETKAITTKIMVDTTGHWYEFVCTVSAQGTSDPKAGNNSYTETFPPKP